MAPWLTPLREARRQVRIGEPARPPMRRNGSMRPSRVPRELLVLGGEAPRQYAEWPAPSLGAVRVDDVSAPHHLTSAPKIRGVTLVMMYALALLYGALIMLMRMVHEEALALWRLALVRIVGIVEAVTVTRLVLWL